MEIAITLAVVVLLTVVTLLVARAGGSRRQLELNEHDTVVGDARHDDEGHPDQPKADRPAGPGAEPMGVRAPGDPSVDPTADDR